MDGARPDCPPDESVDARTHRLRHETALLAEAEREFAEGKALTGAALERFLAWFVSDSDEPPPDSAED